MAYVDLVESERARVMYLVSKFFTEIAPYLGQDQVERVTDVLDTDLRNEMLMTALTGATVAVTIKPIKGQTYGVAGLLLQALRAKTALTIAEASDVVRAVLSNYQRATVVCINYQAAEELKAKLHSIGLEHE